MDSRNRSLMFWGILGEDYSRWLNIPLYGLPPSPNVGLRQIFWNPSKHHWNIVHTRLQATITLTSPTISGFNSTLYFPIHYMWPTRVCCGLDPPKSNQIILESELTFEVWRKSLSVFETSSSHNCTTQKHNAFWPAYHWYRGKKKPPYFYMYWGNKHSLTFNYFTMTKAGSSDCYSSIPKATWGEMRLTRPISGSGLCWWRLQNWDGVATLARDQESNAAVFLKTGAGKQGRLWRRVKQGYVSVQTRHVSQAPLCSLSLSSAVSHFGINVLEQLMPDLPDNRSIYLLCPLVPHFLDIIRYFYTAVTIDCNSSSI